MRSLESSVQAGAHRFRRTCRGTRRQALWRAETTHGNKKILLEGAPILTLDEATSALNSVVESEIQQSLIDFMQNKTVIRSDCLSTARLIQTRLRIAHENLHEDDSGVHRIDSLVNHPECKLLHELRKQQTG